MNWNEIITVLQIVLLAISAYAWGYERGKGDQLQDELDFYEKLEKKHEEG